MQIKTNTKFQEALKYTQIEHFLSTFMNWNSVALPVMNKYSLPYISFQKELVDVMKGRIGRTLLDYGCGTGSIAAMIVNNNKTPIKRIIALDPDPEALRQVPQNLQNMGYKKQIELINSSSMVSLPIADHKVDTIVSGLGAVIYSGFYLSANRLIKGIPALMECLKDCNRVLKFGGILGFSSLIPNPNFKKIKRKSILGYLKAFRFKDISALAGKQREIEKFSRFMKEYEDLGLVHYLPKEQWQEILENCSFHVLEFKEGSYAGQGLVVVAQKL